jgi:hypothetical protein
MSGFALPVLPKYFLDFSTLANSATEEYILADRVPLLHWRELTMKVRVHSHSLTGSNQIQFNVKPQSWTEEDPGIPFVSFTIAAFVVILSSTPSPALLTASIPTIGGAGSIAAMAQITVIGSRAGVGSMNANCSIEFSEKDA